MRATDASPGSPSGPAGESITCSLTAPIAGCSFAMAAAVMTAKAAGRGGRQGRAAEGEACLRQVVRAVAGACCGSGTRLVLATEAAAFTYGPMLSALWQVCERHPPQPALPPPPPRPLSSPRSHSTRACMCGHARTHNCVSARVDPGRGRRER